MEINPLEINIVLTHSIVVLNSEIEMKFAIIGAGASGLAALKHSLDEGHTCEVFEQTAYIGGTWKYVEKVGKDEYGLPIHSSMYEHLRTNKPKELMLFDDFPYRQDLMASYISYSEVLEYINDYADHFGLLSHIKFLHHVENISPTEEGGWLVRVKNLKMGETEEKKFDCVIIGVGHYSTPVTPNIPGIKTFRGTVIHSHDYRKSDPYVGKKVLIVGNGPSGVDICDRLYSVAKQVVLCVRSEKYVDYSRRLSVNIVRKPQIRQFYETGVEFEDESEEEFDDVIYCTGYRISFPFLSSNSGLEVGDNFIKYLYKHTINVEQPTMAVIGIPKNLPLFPMFCLQVRFFLAHVSGHFKVSKEDMLEDVEKYMKNCKESGRSPHMDIGPNFQTFLCDLAETANIKGIRPVIFKMFDFLIHEGLGKFDIAYKIINDDEFEHFRYNN